MSNIYVVIIGSEIVNGFTIDTNTRFISSELFGLGLRVKRILTLRDDPKEILKTLKETTKQADLIITTGGLGPTQDDLTVDILCELTGSKSVYDKYAKHRADLIFTKRYKRLPEKPQINMNWALRQTRIPQKSISLKNSVGLAPGIWIPEIPLLAMPGFPLEIKSIWPYALEKIKALKLKKVHTKIFPIWGHGESALFSQLTFPKGIEIGVHALEFGCRLFLSAEDQELLEDFSQELKEKFAPSLVEDPLSELTSFLKKEKLWLATIESCTGGLCAKLITDKAGASDFFKGSIVSYHNDIKETIVGVSKKTLKEFGAVSRETVAEMASSGLRALGANLALAVTGVAGPKGGSREKPVGTVYLGFADSQEKKVWTSRFFFPLGRERFRIAATYILFLSLYQKYVFFKNSKLWQKKGLGKEFSSLEMK